MLRPPRWALEDQNLYDVTIPTVYRKRFLLLEPSLRRSKELRLSFRFKKDYPSSYANLFFDPLPQDPFLEILLMAERRVVGAVRLSAHPRLPSGFFEVQGFQYRPLPATISNPLLIRDREIASASPDPAPRSRWSSTVRTG